MHVSRRIGWKWMLAAGLALVALPFGPTPAQRAPLQLEVDPGFAPAVRDDQGRFQNVDGYITHGTFSVRAGFFLRRIGGAFREREGAPPRYEGNGNGHASLDRQPGDPPTVTWINHATTLVQLGDQSFLTDPIWSRTASPVSFAGPARYVEPGLALDALPPIDFVVISHNHYDHLDLPTLRTLAARDPHTRFLVPLENEELLRGEGISNVQAFDWGQYAQVGSLTVRCLPSQHWSRRGLTDDRQALWAAWSVSGEGRNVFFGGDTGYWSGFARIGERLGPFDLAILPIGAYEPRAMMKGAHMNPEETVQAAIDLRAAHTLGVHFGTFDLTDEPLDEPPIRFRKAAREQGYGEERAWVFAVGETRAF